MALVVEPTSDGQSYGGFAQMLREVLQELGVPIKRIEYICHGEMGPDAL